MSGASVFGGIVIFVLVARWLRSGTLDGDAESYKHFNDFTLYDGDDGGWFGDGDGGSDD